MLFATTSLTGCFYREPFPLDIRTATRNVKFGEYITITATFRNRSGEDLYMFVQADICPTETPIGQIGEIRDFDEFRFFYAFWGSNFRELLSQSTTIREMENYYKFRFRNGAVITKTITARFIWTPFVRQPANWTDLLNIPQNFYYAVFIVSFSTSRYISEESRVVIRNHIQFNVTH